MSIPARHIDVTDGELLYYPQLFSPDQSRVLFERLRQTIDWGRRQLTLYGKTVTMPRLLAWYADSGIDYRYSGGTSPRHDWTAELLHIKQAVETVAATSFNGALLNLYRDGRDSMGWHSDNEASLGPEPVIASVSLGAERQFQLQHKRRKGDTVKLLLESGSLLLMRGTLQQYWRHQLPKTRLPTGPRINITFRHILA